MARELTNRQAAFVAEYLIDLNATAAARRAGYKDPNIGRQLITKTNVSAAIEHAMQERAEATRLDAQTVIDGLLAEAEYSGEGSSHSARVSAWAHLGKHLGMFTDKSEITLKRDPRNMTTEELEEYLSARGLLE